MARHYENGEDSVTVDSKRLEAYAFLRTQTSEDAVIVTQPTNSLDMKSTYTTAFTGRENFFSGKYILETHNQPVEKREKELRTLFDLTDGSQVQAELVRLGIAYVLLDVRDPQTPLGILLQRHQAVFGNSVVFVYDRRDL